VLVALVEAQFAGLGVEQDVLATAADAGAFDGLGRQDFEHGGDVDGGGVVAGDLDGRRGDGAGGHGVFS
jgi:hypothetical protein